VVLRVVRFPVRAIDLHEAAVAGMETAVMTNFVAVFVYDVTASACRATARLSKCDVAQLF
jgi:hypothetical protein